MGATFELRWELGLFRHRDRNDSNRVGSTIYDMACLKTYSGYSKFFLTEPSAPYVVAELPRTAYGHCES